MSTMPLLHSPVTVLLHGTGQTARAALREMQLRPVAPSAAVLGATRPARSRPCAWPLPATHPK